jgi:hypothetical protein
VTGFGVFLAAIGVADLSAGGLVGDPRNTLRGQAATVATVLVMGLAVGVDGRSLASLTPFTLIAYTGWALLRKRADLTTARAWGALGWLGAFTGFGLLVTGVWRTGLPAAPVAWLLDQTLSATFHVTYSWLAMVIGVALFNTATANAIVRTLLSTAGTNVARSEERLRGGRLIGVLERYLLIGLALAGQPTAAALVVSAKSLLRFPELSSLAQAADASTEVDVVTEYVLLGSLSSWLVALLFVPLIRAAV